MELSEQARAAQREYKREWRQKNKDRIAEHNKRYWERKAEKMAAENGGKNADKD